ncbi:NUDIX hydrolase [Patescibacteria group bacterium]|nr:NUDIX hydrolase [Patescibacteria group bacterium]
MPIKEWQKVRTLKREEFRKGYARELDEVITPAGKKVTYDVIRRDPYPVIIAILPNGKILLVKEHKYPTGKISIGLPMGGSDGQDLIIAARRELEEETNYTSDDFEYLGDFEPNNGFSDATGHVYFTKNVTKATNPAHDPLDDEAIEVLEVTISEFEQMIADGTIKDGPTITAFCIAEKQGKLVDL